jgi:hypothetical protein
MSLELELDNGIDYGLFLGYPRCCIEEYWKPRTPEQITAKKKGMYHLGYRFGQELTELIEREGMYPDIFDYMPPAFTPCSVNCPETITMLTRYKEALIRLDPEAAQGLAEFNWYDMPQTMAHDEEIAKINKSLRIAMIKYP